MAAVLALVRGAVSADLAHDVMNALRKFKGEPVEVVIRKPTSKRTLDQNAYLHAEPFPIIAEYVGCSVEDIKYDLMGEKWGWKPSALDPNRMVPVQPSTSAMTVEQCAEFIDWLIPFAAQKFGCVIRYPNEWAHEHP
jgi:hypothetical protein